MHPRPGPRLWRSRALWLAAPLVALLVAGCGATLYPPDAVTQQGQDIRSLYNIVFIIAAAIFVAVEAAIVFIVLRYRHDRRDETLPVQTHGHTGVEVLWTVVPFVIVAFLFFVSWQTLGKVVADPSQQAGVRIKVVASQWCWEFDYLDEGVRVKLDSVINSKGQNCRDEQGNPPTMVVPVGERIRLQLHSADVIHAFYVPQFVSKLDVVPQQSEARDNVFDFTPTVLGEFRGQCAEFCGLNHAEMQFAVKVVSRADYQAWITEQKNKPSPTPAGSPSPGGSPSAGTTLQLAAIPVQKYDQSSLSAPANTPFVVAFDNRDPGQSHNVAIQDPSGKVVFTGQPIVTGPAQATYNVQGLAPGTYRFFCSVHPTVMFGTLEVH